MFMQQRGYIREKGKMKGKLGAHECTSVVWVLHFQVNRHIGTYLTSSRFRSGVYQLTLTTFSYSSRLLTGIGI